MSSVGAVKERAASKAAVSDWDPPSDATDCRERMNGLMVEIKLIDGQLTMQREEGVLPPTVTSSPARWRRSAVAAKEYLLAEYRFLKDWIREHGSDGTSSSYRDEPTWHMLGMVMRRHKLLLRVHEAAKNLVLDDTDENFDAVVEAVAIADEFEVGLVGEPSA